MEEVKHDHSIYTLIHVICGYTGPVQLEMPLNVYINNKSHTSGLAFNYYLNTGYKVQQLARMFKYSLCTQGCLTS